MLKNTNQSYQRSVLKWPTVLVAHTARWPIPIKIVTDTLIGSNVMETRWNRHFITVIHSARLHGLDLTRVVIAMWLTSDAVYKVRNIPYVVLWGF